MTTHASRELTAVGSSADVVLEVPREDQEAYSRHSYHDYMQAWNALVCRLANARRMGDHPTVERLIEELRHFWPQAGVVAEVAWVSDCDRESALPPAQDR